MTTPVLALIAVAAVSALSLVSAIALLADDEALRRLVPLLINLAVGTLVGGACFDLIPDAIHRHASVLATAVGVIAGYLGFSAVDVLLHAPEHATSSHRTLMLLNLAGDLLHNFIDGALVAAGFLADPAIGVVAAIAIALHEVPRELGSLAIFLHAGLARGTAITLNIASAGSAFIGAGLILLVGAHIQHMVIYALPVAAGTFLYLARTIARQSSDRATRLPLLAAGLAITALAAYIG